MNHTEQAQIELFALLAEHFDEGHKNPFIRWTYADGIEVETTDHESMTKQKHRFSRKILTDKFLRDARATYRQIKEQERDCSCPDGVEFECDSRSCPRRFY